MGEAAKEIKEIYASVETDYYATAHAVAKNEAQMRANGLSEKTIKMQLKKVDKYYRSAELLMRKLEAAYKVAVKHNL